MTETSFPSDPVPVSVATSDLPKRAASAVIMLVVAGAALWQGGAVLQTFIALVALACFVEFVLLVLRATPNLFYRLAAILAGAAYIGGAAAILARLPVAGLLLLISAVICVDTFAYFFGRSIGGPKIAPRISPSKTWAGLLGGTVGATLVMIVVSWENFWLCKLSTVVEPTPLSDAALPPNVAPQTTFGYMDGDCSLFLRPDLTSLAMVLGIGFLIAVVAQSGDFFESWLKRRAGKKDSSNLIPGHGGVFDRVDGLLAVAFLVPLASLFA